MSKSRDFTRLQSGLLVPTPVPTLIIPQSPEHFDLLDITGQVDNMIPQDEYEFIPDCLNRWRDRAFAA